MKTMKGFFFAKSGAQNKGIGGLFPAGEGIADGPQHRSPSLFGGVVPQSSFYALRAEIIYSSQHVCRMREVHPRFFRSAFLLGDPRGVEFRRLEEIIEFAIRREYGDIAPDMDAFLQHRDDLS